MIERKSKNVETVNKKHEVRGDTDSDNPFNALNNVRKSYDRYWNDIKKLTQSLEHSGQLRVAREITGKYRDIEKFQRVVEGKLSEVKKIKRVRDINKEVKNYGPRSLPIQTKDNKNSSKPKQRDLNRLFNGIQGKKGYTN